MCIFQIIIKKLGLQAQTNIDMLASLFFVGGEGLGQESAKTIVVRYGGLLGFMRLTTLARPAKSGTVPFESLREQSSLLARRQKTRFALFCGRRGTRTPNPLGVNEVL